MRSGVMVAECSSQVASLKSPRRLPYALIFVSTTIITLGCAGTQTSLADGAQPRALQQTSASSEGTSVSTDDQRGGVANLPYARGATFRCLDDYLAHLERQGAIDLPWWREVSPGVYEHVARSTNAQREVATRAELMARFGFSC